MNNTINLRKYHYSTEPCSQELRDFEESTCYQTKRPIGSHIVTVQMDCLIKRCRVSSTHKKTTRCTKQTKVEKSVLDAIGGKKL